MFYKLAFLIALALTLSVTSITEANHCVDQGGTVDGNCTITTISGPESRTPSYDPDGDGIPNRRDGCPTEFALDPSGCRHDNYDSDGDGLPDGQDWCPTLTFGGITSGETGCPGEPTPEDSDADRVPNGEDLCPNEPGSALVGGCMDSDGDRTPDRADQCPHLPGVNNGCPDTDVDGFNDAVDSCPTRRAGPNSTNGCAGSGS